MKILKRSTVFAAIFLAASVQLPAQPNSAAITPQAVLDIMQRVGDWQLAHEATNRPTGWIQSVGDVGVMALAGISGDAKYRDAMLAKGETNGWQLPQYRGRLYHADDQCYGQVCAELYFLYRENRMIGPMREHFDYILANPPAMKGLDNQDQWSWCDALFMAPPTWARLYAATDDPRYLDFAVTNWWRTSDYLYDKSEHLFFRDSTFFSKTEANGKKIFWSRGNGWVLAATARMLEYLPMNHPDRPRFEQLFKEMAGKIVSLQQEDGLWRASLLDAADFPTPEASGSALFTYGLAWGVNQGLLDRGTFEPAVRKAWVALVGCVNEEGRLTHVQPAGDRPVQFSADATSPYGGGVFLLAGSEMYRMAVLENAKPVVIKVTNPGNFRRDIETVEIALNDDTFRSLSGKKPTVMDGLSSRMVTSQVYASETNQAADKLVFQVDLAPGETRTFDILADSTLAAEPRPIVKTFARYVPERYDDFAWESDRIAHRAYGLALIKAEGTISSGPDVWIKTWRNLMVNEMYASGHYHMDNGDEMDDFRVGNSRGCGGLGVWDGKKIHVSSNYRNWKLITTGAVRSVFELAYDAWDAGGGRMVSETKRYSIDAGSYFTKAQSTFECDDKSPLTIGVGLAERACGTNGTELIAQDQTEGWMSYWQPEDKPKGHIGTALVLAKNSVEEFTNDKQELPDAKIHAEVPQPTHEGAPPVRNLLAVTKAEIGKPLTYYFGACWDRSGDFTNDTQWAGYVKRFAERRDEPLKVEVGK